MQTHNNLQFNQVFNLDKILNVGDCLDYADTPLFGAKCYEDPYFDTHMTVTQAWRDYVQDTLDALNGIVSQGVVCVSKIQSASYSITELYDMSVSYRYGTKTYNMVPHLKDLLRKL